jgi:hypothetical protein
MADIVPLSEVNVDPLGDTMLDFLIDMDQEEAFIDFKETLSTSKSYPFPKIAKDIFAFSNYGGGFLLIGFKERKTPLDSSKNLASHEKRRFLPVGLPTDYCVDSADLQSKFNAYCINPITLFYKEFTRSFGGVELKFAALYIPGAIKTLTPSKDGLYKDEQGKSHQAFNANIVLFRRGTQSVPATVEEIEFIKSRASRSEYRLSVIDGRPDEISETLYSNLLEVKQVPERVWSGSLGDDFRYKQHGIPQSIVYITWDGKAITFSDLSQLNNPLRRTLEISTITCQNTAAWLTDQDKQDVIIWLLNKELVYKASCIRLQKEDRKNKFYFPCDSENRKETWTPRYRKTSALSVAQRMWASQLNRFIWWHLAVSARFHFING